MYKINSELGGALAQSVEQRTENPCVPGSIPGGTTAKAELKSRECGAFFIGVRPERLF